MRVCALGDACIDFYPKLCRYYPTGNTVDFGVYMKRVGFEVSLESAIGFVARIRCNSWQCHRAFKGIDVWPRSPFKKARWYWEVPRMSFSVNLTDQTDVHTRSQ
jgi:hypothetical protein